jgi:hypothetical protein
MQNTGQPMPTNNTNIPNSNNVSYYKFYVCRKIVINILTKITIELLSQSLDLSSDIKNIQDNTIEQSINKFNNIDKLKTELQTLFGTDFNNSSSEIQLNIGYSLENFNSNFSIDKLLDLYQDVYLKLYLKNILTKTKYNEIKRMNIPDDLNILINKIFNTTTTNTTTSTNRQNNRVNNYNQNGQIVENIKKIVEFKQNLNNYSVELNENLLNIVNYKTSNSNKIGTDEYKNIAMSNIKNAQNDVINSLKIYNTLINSQNKNSKKYFSDFIKNYLNLITAIHKLFIFSYECKNFCS